MAKKKVKRKPEAGGETEAAVDFEQALAELEVIVNKLEGGELSLDATLAGYEQGIACLKVCHARLQHAQRRIEILSGVDAQGNPVTEPYDDGEDESLEAKHASRGRRRTAPSAQTEVEDDSLLF